MQNSNGAGGNVDHSLTVLEDSVLIVIDVQQPFVDKLAADKRAPVVNRIAWIVSSDSYPHHYRICEARMIYLSMTSSSPAQFAPCGPSAVQVAAIT